MNRLAGTAYITVDGNSFSIAGEGTYRPSAPSRETVKGQDAVHGYKEMPEAGRISWRGRVTAGVPVSVLDLTDCTVVLVSAAGATVIGQNMFRVGEPIEVNTEEGTFEAAFEGPTVTETF